MNLSGKLAGLAIVAVVAWLLLPGPFAHGVIIGMIVAPGLLIGGVSVFVKRLAKRKKVKGLEPPTLPNASWDYSMPLADLNGEAFSFADVAAGRVVVLNFWATWCSPCLAELPSLQRLRAATADLDVRFGFITKEDRSLVRKFVAKREIDLPIYTLSGEPPECFQGRGIPATFVVDKTGMIALRHFGAASWDDDRVVAFVRGLAAKPTAA